MAGLILIVDDDPVQRRLMEAALGRAGLVTLSADSGAAALAALDGPRGGDIKAMVLDLVMPGMGGLEVLAKMAERAIAVPAIVQTARGGIETVVQAMRAGAFDFVVKPVSPDRLQQAVNGALKLAASTDAPKRQRRDHKAILSFADILTESPAMERVLRLGRKAAASNIPILIEGESGVGKELVARAIQGAGQRKTKPFVTVNCGAIPDNLVESILFGHEKGAFTGATEKHPGKFVEANGGTLFLDEIGDLPLEAQVKLLRAVQEGEIEAVGARGTQKVDIRLISATHRDLQAQVVNGGFREDLYYRLNVFPIRVPPLRERREDIGLLAQHFVRRISQDEKGGLVSGISAGALALLSAHDWPGNIRQLENAVFRAVILADGPVLTEAEFPQIAGQIGGLQLEKLAAERLAQPEAAHPAAIVALAPAAPASSLSALDPRGHVRKLSDVEVEMIRYAIDHYDGQMSEVARRLGIGRSTLYRKFKEYGIEPDEGRAQARTG